MKTVKEMLMERVIPEPNSGCWLWLGATTRGYGSFRARGYNLAHSASYETFRGPIPAGLFVCHKCDTPACINPDHFFLGTAKDNAQDAAAKGRICTDRGFKSGYDNPYHTSILTPEQVKEIADLRGNVSAVKVARRYGMNPASIYHIWGGRAWVHITGFSRVPLRVSAKRRALLSPVPQEGQKK